jgi:predicted acylesterase/phospholipase RssA/CRP-like cAMP-binding protein
MFSPDKLAELTATPLFAGLTPCAFDELLSELQVTSLSGGAILFRAGDAGDSMYVVLSGRLRVSVECADGAEEIIREIARGESVGELALLTGEARSATIRAIRDTTLAVLSRSAFERAIQFDPTLIRQVAVQLASRQRQGRDGPMERRNLRTIAVLPCDDSDQANEFALWLANALTKIAPTLCVSAASIATESSGEFFAPNEERAAEAELTARLDALEVDHRAIVYQADADLNAWTKRCVRQADLILVVGRADVARPDAALRQMRDYFDSCTITARIELVLLHSGEVSHDFTTAKWTGPLGTSAHHHIVAAEPADVGRLARLITGNGFGLVLSGGGARGFAHIGVIRALQERNMPIDMIGGTSMGAVIAAQHALGWDWQTMARVNRDEWPRCEPQKNYTLPLVALNSARRMDHMLRKMFGNAEIENLRTKFFCVSTNLTTAAAKIHQQGVLWKAVRASVSIPGIGPPAIENGEILIDGGLVDNLPVETMKRLCQGRVCAVDVSEQVAFTSKLSESYTVSGWKLLWQQLSPFSDKPDIPNILNTLYRTITVGGIRAIDSAKAQANLCFEPPVGQFNVFEWCSVDKIIEVGYRYALRKLDESGHPGLE